MKKFALKGIVMCLCAIFLMSHNVSALELTQDVDLIRGNMVVQFGSCGDCTNLQIVSGNGGNTTVALTSGSTLGWAKRLSIVLPSENYSVGDYLTFDVYMFSDQNNNTLDGFLKSLSPTYITPPFDLVDVQFESLSSGSAKATFTLRFYTASSSFSTFYLQSSSNSFMTLYEKEYLTGGYATHWRPKSGTNYTGSIQNVVNAINNQPNYTNNLNNINNTIEDVKDTIEDRNEQEDEALDNIANQDPSDLEGDTDNQQSTNLIGAFSSFVSALSNITAAGNCNITLAFPNFAGGSQTVNVCQNKDKGGNIVPIFSSLTLIIFYIPLALKLLSMIYNEIRSFTNG